MPTSGRPQHVESVKRLRLPVERLAGTGDVFIHASRIRAALDGPTGEER
jgi:hypothetical protein